MSEHESTSTPSSISHRDSEPVVTYGPTRMIGDERYVRVTTQYGNPKHRRVQEVPAAGEDASARHQPEGPVASEETTLEASTAEKAVFTGVHGEVITVGSARQLAGETVYVVTTQSPDKKHPSVQEMTEDEMRAHIADAEAAPVPAAAEAAPADTAEEDVSESVAATAADAAKAKEDLVSTVEGKKSVELDPEFAAALEKLLAIIDAEFAKLAKKFEDKSSTIKPLEDSLRTALDKLQPKPESPLKPFEAGEGTTTPETAPVAAKELSSYTDDMEGVPMTGKAEAETVEQLTSQEINERQKALRDAEDKYAEVNAKQRNGYLDRTVKKGGWVTKIPFFGKKIEDRQEQRSAEFEAARADYVKALDAYMQTIRDSLTAEHGENADKIREGLAAGYIAEDLNLENKLISQREALGKKGAVGKFISKHPYITMVGAGLVTGATLGAAGVGIVGAGIAGAGVGALMGRTQNRHRANTDAGTLFKKAGHTISQEQSTADHAAKTEALNAAAADKMTETIVKGTESRTKSESKGNIVRLGKAALVTGSAAMSGNRLYSFVDGQLFNGNLPGGADAIQQHVAGSTIEGHTPGVDTAAEKAAQAKAAAEAKLNATLNKGFTVNPGDGYIKTIRHFAEQNGFGELTSKQAEAIHNGIVNTVGTDYINMDNFAGPDTYMRGADARLSAPGSAHWAPEAINALKQGLQGLSIR